MPYLGKQPAASALVVESGSIQSAEIEDGTIEDSDISSDFKGLLSGSAVVNASSVTAANISGSITSTGSFGKVEVGDGKIITAGNMVLDADGAQIRLEDGGTEFGRISRVSSDLVIKSISNNNDILFKGVGGSSTITALSLDMSEGGNAEFSGNVSGSLVSTASFGSVNATHLNGVFEGTLGSVANALISGSTVVNAPNISGSITSTGSFGSLVVADKVQGDLDLGGSITAAGDISTSGSIFAREFHTEFTSASVVFASGSNKFGDDSGDTHRFTGSMLVSGSITMADGDLTVTDNLDIEGDVDINGTTNLDVVDIDGNVTIGNTVVNPASGFADQTGIGLKHSATVPEVNISSDAAGLQVGRTSTGGAGNIAEFRKESNVVFNIDTAGSVSGSSTSTGSFASARFIGTGGVGIGTNHPSGALHVNGANPTVFITNSTQDGASTLLRMTEKREVDGNAGGYLLYNGSSNIFQIGTNISSTDTPSITLLRDGSGFVGIGTNNPDRLLHVQGNGGGQAIAVFEDDTVNANVLISATDSNRNSILNFGDAASTEIGQVDYDHADNSMRFVTNASEAVRITSGGNVGIGTNTPGDIRLVVRDNDTSTGTGDPVRVGTNASSSLFRVQPRFNSVLDIGQGADPYPMWIQAADISNLAQYYELSLNPVGGNVGIGTLNPTKDLHIDNQTSSAGCNVLVQSNASSGWVGSSLILNVQNAVSRGAGVFMHNEDADKGFYAGVIYNVSFDRYSICYEATATQTQQTAAADHEIVQIQTDGDYLSTTGTAIQTISDRRLKENIQDFTGGLDVLKNLQPRTFEWKEGRGNNRFGRTGTQYGFIAQEIESGSGVVDNMNLYKKVDIKDGDLDSDILDGTKYQSQLNAKDALYISAIKELSEKIELQQKQIEELKEGQNG